MIKNFKTHDEFIAYLRKIAESDDTHAVNARGVLSIHESITHWIERERERGTTAPVILTAMYNVAINILTNGVMALVEDDDRANAMHNIACQIHETLHENAERIAGEEGHEEEDSGGPVLH